MKLSAVIAVALTIGNVQAPLVGYPSVYDGDTIYVNDKPVRLYGIDAEELGDVHGELAKLVLVQLVGDHQVRCVPTGKRSYGRMVAICYTDDGRNLNEEMVKHGAALDCPRYSAGLYASLEPPGIRTLLSQTWYCNPSQ